MDNKQKNLEENQKPAMIQWTGKNLKELVQFTGKSPKFDEWFKTWEDFENYVHTHNNIFKIFNEDGSHIEIPVGAWIVKTPDGHNVASRYVFKQKPAWSREDEQNLNAVLSYIKDEYLRRWLKYAIYNRYENSSGWGEEDKRGFADTLWAIEQARTIAKDENDMGNLWYAERWLKSLKGRIQQPKQEEES